MKKKNEPGLNYMIELGLKPERTYKNCMRALARASNEATAFMFSQAITDRGSRGGGMISDEQFYDMKNQTLDFSLALTGSFDGDFVRKACNWLVEHKEVIQGNVLDIGCDCGLISCFIARLVPECHVTAIDQSANAAMRGRELAERLHVENIEFVHADLASFSQSCKEDGRRFQTVVSSRVSQENQNPYTVDCRGKGFCEEAGEIAESLRRYVALIESVLAEDGLLISIERAGVSYPKLLGLLIAMHDIGLVSLPPACSQLEDGSVLLLPNLSQLECAELESTIPYSAFLSARMEDEQGKAVTTSATASFLSMLSTFDPTQAMYASYEAKLVEDIRRGSLIRGYKAFDDSGSEIWRWAAWNHDHDPTSVLFYQDINGATSLCFYDISRMPEIYSSIEELRTRAIVKRLKVTPMDKTVADNPSELLAILHGVQAKQGANQFKEAKPGSSFLLPIPAIPREIGGNAGVGNTSSCTPDTGSGAETPPPPVENASSEKVAEKKGASEKDSCEPAAPPSGTSSARAPSDSCWNSSDLMPPLFRKH